MISEEDIRPKKIFDKYLELAQEDKLFFEDSKRETINCPACGTVGKKTFSKHGFDYDECPNCKTIFVNPRPKAEEFFKYYRESKSSKYFAETFYKETASARRELLWKPKAELVNEILYNYLRNCKLIIDIGGGHGIFDEEFKKISNIPIKIIEPGPMAAEILREKGFDVIQSFLEEIPHDYFMCDAKAFVSFELFEHLHSCESFLNSIHKMMVADDLLIFTTLSGTGLDIQGLRENSNSISLQHLNFFNPISVAVLGSKLGFKIKSISTPGKLDIDILLKNRDLIKNEKINSLLTKIEDENMCDWQEFIANNYLSSHMLVIFQK